MLSPLTPAETMEALANTITFDLPDRGIAIAQYVDLYDEGRFGAGQLAWRGRFDSSNIDTIANDVIFKLLIGEERDEYLPMSKELAVNRLNDPFVRYAVLPELGDEYPHKSQFMVHFRLRIKFNSDAAVIDFGKRWAKYRNNDGTLNDQYPLGKYTDQEQYKQIDEGDLEILNTCGISYNDAFAVLTSFMAGFGKNIDPELSDEAIKESVIAGEISDKQLKAVKSSLQKDEYIATAADSVLYHNDAVILTVTE